MLRDRPCLVGFSGANIRAERDSDIDPIRLAGVKYVYSDKPSTSKLTFGLSTEIRKALSEDRNDVTLDEMVEHFSEIAHLG
jgi:hypothetical protein